MALETLDMEAIAQLLQSSRQRGQYDIELRNFIEGGEVGAEVDLTSGVFAGKKPQTVKTGFEGAARRKDAPEDAQHVRVIVQGERVYLVRQDLVQAQAAS